MVGSCWLCSPAMAIMMDSGTRVGQFLFSFFFPSVLVLEQCLNVIRSVCKRLNTHLNGFCGH
jgi:hypothetical protein